jgi:hypothetical protein
LQTSATLQSIGMGATAIDVLHALDGVLPVENENLARQQFQRREFAYSPDGTLSRTLRASGIAFVGFVLTLGLLVWWIRWNTNRLFLADEETNAPGHPASEPVEEMWSKRPLDEQLVLLQVARERIANPHQRETITRLLEQGLLCLAPGLRPCSKQFDVFLQQKARQLQAEVRDWEDVKGGYGWRYVRLILIASVAALGFFLIATQPSLQSSLIGIASTITGALTAGLKLRDALMSWLPTLKSTR